MRSSSSMRRLEPARTGRPAHSRPTTPSMRDDRRRHLLRRIGEGERHHRLVDDRGDRLELRQRLQPRLRLARLRRLVAEAVDEGLHVPALVVLLPLQLELQRLPLAPLPLEGIIAAAIERELALIEMDDAVDGAVEEVAVVADEEHGPRIAGEIGLEPDRAFEVEIVGRLVEKQEVRLGEEHRGERDAHPPAARKRRAGAALRRRVEAEAGEDRRRRALRPNGRRCRRAASGCRRCGADRSPSRPRRAGTARSVSAASTTSISDSSPDGASCATWPMRALRGRLIEPVFGRDLAGDQAEQRRLAAAVPPDQTGLGAVRQGDGGVVEEERAPDPVGEVVDVKHGGRVIARPGGFRQVLPFRPRKNRAEAPKPGQESRLANRRPLWFTPFNGRLAFVRVLGRTIPCWWEQDRGALATFGHEREERWRCCSAAR